MQNKSRLPKQSGIKPVESDAVAEQTAQLLLHLYPVLVCEVCEMIADADRRRNGNDRDGESEFA